MKKMRCKIEGCGNVAYTKEECRYHRYKTYKKVYYQKNKDKLKVYYQKNKDKLKVYKQIPEYKASQKAYRQTPQFKVYKKAYRQTPQYKAYNKARMKAYRQTLKSITYEKTYNHSPKTIYRNMEKKELVYGRKMLMTLEQFTIWYNSQPKVCHYCHLREDQLHLVSDKLNNRTRRLTIDKMNPLEEYSINNIVLCCSRCNMIKSDFITSSEMEEIGKKYIRPRWIRQLGEEK